MGARKKVFYGDAETTAAGSKKKINTKYTVFNVKA